MPQESHITPHDFDRAADAFYDLPTDPTLNEQGNRRKRLEAAFAALGIRVGPDVIFRECVVCGETITAPNKGLGRAKVAAWEPRHQHPEVA